MGSEASNRTRVLVIDDHHDGGESLGILLGQMGCEVQVARGGLEAIAAAPTFRPHLVITDINMPGLDGYETARRLKRQPWAKSALFVAYSGKPQRFTDPESSQTEFCRHITKPGTPSDFETILSEVRSAGFEKDSSGVATEGGGV